MARTCATCTHPERLEIDRALIAGESILKISRLYGVSANSLHNHAQNHLSRQLVQAMEKKQLTQDFDLLNKIDSILTRTEQIFTRNFNKKRDRIALEAIKEQRNTIELLAKISFALHEAKKLEAQQTQSSHIEEQNQQLMEDLKVLTIDELKVFMALTQKIESQDKTIKVLPQLPSSRFETGFDGEYDTNEFDTKNLDDEPKQKIQSSRFDPGFDSRLDTNNLDNKLESNLDNKLESKLESNLDTQNIDTQPKQKIRRTKFRKKTFVSPQ